MEGNSMRGLMQDSALTVDKILDHAKTWHGDREVVTRSVEGPIVRTTYAEIHGRAKKVSNLLVSMGVTLGDRVATLAWNTARHIEAWYGIMGIGAICHTLNPRLHPEQIAWIINHAEDKVIFVDLTFVPILEAILAHCPSVEQVVIMTDQAHMPAFKLAGVPGMKFGGAHCYETAIAGQSGECAWGGFDENTACGLCYTSGTTGDPKGVLYSHRSNYIHALVGLQTDVLGMSGLDTVLPVVPMFHANAWGTAFACPAVGAKMVLPGPKMDGASIYELLDSEQATFSAAVPTVWQMLLAELDGKGLKLPYLRKVVIGGSACPEAIIRGFKERYDVDVLHAWGMTETSPLGTLGSPNARVAALSFDEQMPYKLKQGRPPLGIEMKLTDDAGNTLPHDGETFGHLKVKGPFVAGAYFKGAGGQILDAEGFFDTGDVATIDSEGFMQITDRAKDVIKSGGEWISSIDIENIAMGHPKAANAAVIGIAHPKWDERPLLLVQLKPGVEATKEEFIEYLQGKIAKWWMPDDVIFVDDIPLGATGKIDKKVLRARFADYSLPEVPLPAAMAAAAAATPSLALRAEPDPVIHAPEPPAAEAEAADPFESAAAPDAQDAVAEDQGDPPDDPPALDEHQAMLGDADPRIEVVADAGDAEPVAEPAARTDDAPVAAVAAAVAGPSVAEALIAEAKAAEASPPLEEPSAPPPQVEDEPPLFWGPGGAEPPRAEHVKGKGGADEVPPPLPGMPDMTPLAIGAAAAATGAVLAKETAAPKAAPVRAPAKAGEEALAIPPAKAAAETESLAFTPAPFAGGNSKKPKAKGGLVDHYLTIAMLVALAPLAIVVIGAAGGRFLDWSWRESFQTVFLSGPTPNLGWAPAIALVGVVTGVIGLLAAAFGGWKRHWRKAMAVFGVTLATLAALAALALTAGRHPSIHDVATDWSEPLLFSHAVMQARGPGANIVEPSPVAPLDAGAFAGRPVAEINMETCPAARPMILNRTPAEAYAAVKAAMLAEGMALVTDNPATGRLEATATSLVYGFRSDVVARVQAQGVGARVDLRSISRAGEGDMGANCGIIGGIAAAMAR
jgi:fatty-acyl-CoA synthase